MNLFQQLAPLVSSGIVMRMTVRMHGDKLQLDIIPEVEAGKTGISVPAQALIGTAEELDAGVPGFLAAYAQSAADLNEQIAVANAVMGKAQDAAKEVVKAAASRVKPASSAGAKPTGSTSEAKVDRAAAGFLDMDEDESPENGAEVKAPAAVETSSVVATELPVSETGENPNLFLL
ncbi:PRTRC system protein E [Polaromonas sp. AER18D-145]|uniref:PRTRC system protein E n=1 Tax=Polaromonas sp. AER18D-145 TaxID=1977060 RepID=UPI000BBBE474|nr:PRTRC system protein E [Polaromonas sp. AER18D-145]